MAESDRKIAVYPHQHDAAYQGDALAPATVKAGTTQSDFTEGPLIASGDFDRLVAGVRISADNLSGSFVGVKARGTYGAPAIISASDELMKFDGFGWDGSAWVPGARIIFMGDGAPGASDMPGRILFGTTSDGAATTTERWRITASGIFHPGVGNTYDLASAARSVRRLHANMLHLGNPLTPAQITADAHDYNPGGILQYAWRLSTDASRNLTGTVNGVDGALHLLVNVGAFDLVLVHESASSSAANRFLCPGSVDVTLNPNDSVDIWYDTTSSRWRVKGI